MKSKYSGPKKTALFLFLTCFTSQSNTVVIKTLQQISPDEFYKRFSTVFVLRRDFFPHLPPSKLY